MKKKQIFRVLDANFNRSREGLRVCEEISRFVLDDAALTKELKKIRHGISRCLEAPGLGYLQISRARDSHGDVGQMPSRLEQRRKNTLSLFVANMERVKEALRVLEEFSKLVDVKSSEKFKKIRFKAYVTEKSALPKLETLRHRR